MAESFVVPHLDDLTFFDSRRSEFRGGIYADTLRKQHELDISVAAGTTEEESDAESVIDVPEAANGRENPLRKRARSLRADDSRSLSDVSEDASENNFGARAASGGGNGPTKKRTWLDASKNFLSGSSSSVSLSSHSDASTAKATKSPASMPSSPVPPQPRNVPPPWSSPQDSKSETAPVNDPLNQDHSAAHRLRGMLERDELQRPESSPPGLQRRSSTDSKKSNASHVEGDAKSSRPPSIHMQPPSAEPTPVSPVPIAPSPQPDSPSPAQGEPQLSSSGESDTPSIFQGPSETSPSSSPAPPVTAGGFLPPPRRNVPAESRGEGNLLETIKARANDKQALAASVNQARDAMKRWGATWGKRAEAEKEYSPEVRDAVLNAGQTTPEFVSEPRPRSASQQSRPTVSGSGVSLASGHATTSLSTSQQDEIEADADPPRHSSVSGRPSSVRSMDEASTSPSVYKPAPMMSIPGIADPSHRGGIGSHGPQTIVPQRPGDIPERQTSTNNGRLLPASLKGWGDRSKTQQSSTAPSSEASTSSSAPQVPPRRVPPPFFPKKDTAGQEASPLPDSAQPALASVPHHGQSEDTLVKSSAAIETVQPDAPVDNTTSSPGQAPTAESPTAGRLSGIDQASGAADAALEHTPQDSENRRNSGCSVSVADSERPKRDVHHVEHEDDDQDVAAAWGL